MTQFWIWEIGSPGPPVCNEDEELLLEWAEGQREQPSREAKATSSGDHHPEGWRAAPAPAQGVRSGVHVPCQHLKVRTPPAS